MKKAIFYHVAAMGHWRSVVLEQVALLKSSGWDQPVHVGFVGPYDQSGYLHQVFAAAEIPMYLCAVGELNHYEFPTLQALWKFANQCDGPYALCYFHTKAVSKLDKWPDHHWRLLMNACCIAEWRARIADLDTHDFSGTSLPETQFHGAPPELSKHYQGNFWWARSESVKCCPSPKSMSQQKSLPYKQELGHRLLAEIFLAHAGPERKWAAAIQERLQLYSHQFWAGRQDLQQMGLLKSVGGLALY